MVNVPLQVKIYSSIRQLKPVSSEVCVGESGEKAVRPLYCLQTTWDDNNILLDMIEMLGKSKQHHPKWDLIIVIYHGAK